MRIVQNSPGGIILTAARQHQPINMTRRVVVLWVAARKKEREREKKNDESVS